MTDAAVALAGLVLVVLLVRAVWIIRQEAKMPDDGRPRGTEPGPGYTEIMSEYSSGIGGGTQLVTRVPKDPQAYARSFVPKQKK